MKNLIYVSFYLILCLVLGAYAASYGVPFHVSAATFLAGALPIFILNAHNQTIITVRTLEPGTEEIRQATEDIEIAKMVTNK